MGAALTLAATCGNCPFWAGTQESPSGDCRFDPPKIFLFPVAAPPQKKLMLAEGQANQPALSMIGQTAFPSTPADGWCGMHPERSTLPEDDSFGE